MAEANIKLKMIQMDRISTGIFLLLALVCQTARGQRDTDCPKYPNGTCVDGRFSVPGACNAYMVCDFCQKVLYECDAEEVYEPVYERCVPEPDNFCAVNDTAFAVALAEGFTGPLDRLRYDDLLVNHGNDYSPTTGVYRAPRYSGHGKAYLFHLSAALEPGKPLVLIVDGLPFDASVIVNSTLHDEDIVSRTFIAQLDELDNMTVALDEGAAIRGLENRTLWTGFSIDDYTETSPCAFSASNDESFGDTNEVIPFPETFVDTCGAEFLSNGTFIAPEAGVYYFSFSSGVEISQGLEVQLTINGVAETRVKRSLMSATGDEYSMISKSFLVPLGAKDNVAVQLMSGLCYPGDSYLGDSLISFTGFRFDPVEGELNNWAWSVHTTKEQTGPTDRLDWDVIRVSERNMFNFNADIVEISVNGFYYISLSVGISGSSSVWAQITRFTLSGDVYNITDIYKTGHPIGNNEVDTVSRSTLVYLDDGDKLRVAIPDGSTVYSDPSLITSFSGFLVKRFNPVRIPTPL